MRRVKKKRDFVGVSVRSAARTRIKAFAETRRMNFADAADVASVLLERATREQLDPIIERREPESAALA